MRNSFLNIIFPPSCIVCTRPGAYLCVNCRKIFKYNIPECYICRRISGNYTTHPQCKKKYSLDWVYVAWEYNKVSSRFIKQYKYKNVYDMRENIADFFLDTFLKSSTCKLVPNTLLVPVPISTLRMSERGFNQMVYISRRISNHFHLDMSTNLLACKSKLEHQASKSKSERLNSSNNFYVNCKINISKYKSITLLDDVITTGGTLERITKVLKDTYGTETPINALCLFRGKPHF